MPKILIKNSNNIQMTLSRPRVTEKAVSLSQGERGVFVFEVPKNANKILVKSAIKELYKVTPLKVNVINIPSKKVFSRGKRGTVSGFKKAIVYLKKGDKIEL